GRFAGPPQSLLHRAREPCGPGRCRLSSLRTPNSRTPCEASHLSSDESLLARAGRRRLPPGPVLSAPQGPCRVFLPLPVIVSLWRLSASRRRPPHSSFFFQAEDGIRGGHVTGVQTCALPISSRNRSPSPDQCADPVTDWSAWRS